MDLIPMIKQSTRLRVTFLVALLLAAGSESVSATDGIEPDFEVLIGNWRRADGGYIIEIHRIDPDGKMEVGYFNPRPIHVSRAEASRIKSKIGIEVELRDTGYPGSAYTLVYVPEKDTLVGYYFHAVSGQYFDVRFVRMK